MTDKSRKPKNYEIEARNAVIDQLPDGHGFVLMLFSMQEHGSGSLSTNITPIEMLALFNKVGENLAKKALREVEDNLNGEEVEQ